MRGASVKALAHHPAAFTVPLVFLPRRVSSLSGVNLVPIFTDLARARSLAPARGGRAGDRRLSAALNRSRRLSENPALEPAPATQAPHACPPTVNGHRYWFFFVTG